jgi:acetyl esterase/lipase
MRCPLFAFSSRVTLRASFLAFFASACTATAAPQVIELWPGGVPGLRADATPEKEENGRFTNIHRPTLVVFPAAAGKANGTAVIYAPGGGYIRVASGVNGGEVTTWLNSLGVTVFLLKYRNVEYGHPAPLRDALQAIRTVRSRAEEFGLKPDRIGMLGGSAGGHLVASAGTLFDAPEGKTGAALDGINARPDFLIMIFPVISMRESFAHAASRKALLGEHPTPELMDHLSVERQVTKQTPPAFLVHTMEDKTVPVENTLAFYQALKNAGISAEMHLYARGPHGSGLDPKLGTTALWPRRCEEWMRANSWLPAAK